MATSKFQYEGVRNHATMPGFFTFLLCRGTWRNIVASCWATAAFKQPTFHYRFNIKTDSPYASYLQDLLERLFDFRPSVTAVRRGSTVDLYITSTYLMKELRSIGIYSTNKVRDQVGIPDWIFLKAEYQRRFVRGVFDTDGSIYELKHFHAVQMSFRNRLFRLLEGTRRILLNLGFHASTVSSYSVYLTRREDIRRYVQEIGLGIRSTPRGQHGLASRYRLSARRSC